MCKHQKLICPISLLHCLVFLLISVNGFSQQKYTYYSKKAEDNSVLSRLPNDVMPVQACWFWTEDEFKPDGFKVFIDSISIHSPYNMVSASVRLFGRETTTDAVHNQIKLAAEYAVGRRISMVADLDVRTARRAFESLYPDELQEMLLLKEVEISSVSNVETVVFCKDLSDHYTGRTTHYIPLYGKLLRVYSYIPDVEGIDPNSLEDITRNCVVLTSSKDSVKVRIPVGKENTKACVFISFTHLYPDVFAPHLLEFQREIIRQYSDVPLAGVFKDEWGFPPCFDGSPAKNQFWYSKHRAQAYTEKTGGGDLLFDCLLMYKGVKGQERERQKAINYFMDMSWQRNGEIESDYYLAVKEIFGPDAAVTTHPTWWPYPDLREQMKNGLDWWSATRDWAQTDEFTPFAVRTALSKKWGSPVWYNMFYSTNRTDYEKALWSSALAGGRINYHPIYPSERKGIDNHLDLLRGKLMQAESRVNLLNFISQSPMDCPVALVFGHACTMNWAGPSYDDVGMELADALWKEGIPTDLIPSSEIENKNLVIDHEGWIRYGEQKYSAVILYHPEFEKSTTADFFNRAAKGKTRLFRMGDWTKDFDANNFDGNSALPEMLLPAGNEQVLGDVKNILKQQKIELQTPAIQSVSNVFNHIFITPPTTGFCRLIDGTIIQVAGTNNTTGDPIRSKIKIRGETVSFDAIGIASVRLDENGKVQTLAVCGLKSFRTRNFKIELNERIDLALWKNEQGEWKGYIHDWEGNIPAPLLGITSNWTRISLPVPLLE